MPEDPRSREYRTDPRVAVLLEPCDPLLQQFYDRDTSYMVPVLIEKLRSGQLGPLRQAKEELGSMGEDAARELRRLFDRNYASAMESGRVENAIDAASLHPSGLADELLRRALDHPAETVRRKAIDGLLGNRRLEQADFERLLPRLDGPEAGSLKASYARGLFEADPVRAARLVAGWIRDGERIDLLPAVLQPFAGVDDPEAARIAAEHFGDMPEDYRALVAAPAARAGDAKAQEFLRSELEGDDAKRRLLAIQGAAFAGLEDLLGAALLEDEDENARLLAADFLARDVEAVDPEAVARLRTALDDPSPMVRAHVLELLVGLGDSVGTERAIALLERDGADFQAALLALHLPMRDRRALAERTFESLVARAGRERSRPLSDRQAIFQGLSLVPTADAALFLRKEGVQRPDEVTQSLPAHRWLMIQAMNTGEAGARALFEELPLEQDPQRRLDLIESIASSPADFAREALLSVAEDPEVSPYEALFTASLLVKIGPATVLAPRLKRVCYSIEATDARLAFQCLLWTWY